MNRRPLAIAILLGFSPAWMPTAVFAQLTGEPPLPEDLPQQTVTSGGEQHRVPDLPQTRLGQLRFEEQGVFIDPTQTLPPAAWNQGETAADAITIGSAQTTFQRQITLEQITRIGGFEPRQFPLDGIPPVAGASLSELARAVPNLGKTRLNDSFLRQIGNRRRSGVLPSLQRTVFGNKEAQDVAQFITERPELSQVPIQSLIDRDWGGVVKGAVRVALTRLLRQRGENFGSIAVGRLDLDNPAGAVFAGAALFRNLGPSNAIQRALRRDRDATINDFIRDNPNLKDVPITALGDISSIRVGDIPGLATTDLAQIPSAKAHALSSIPGAGNVRLGQLVKGLRWTTPVLGKLGPAFGSNDGVESVAERSVSGGTPSNRFRAHNCSDGDCAHFEFDTLSGSPIPAGRTWVGGQQQTRGGVGPLAAVNGGKEPAGIKINDNFPFKFVLRRIDGQDGGKPGTATQYLYFQQCIKPPFAPKTCTPHHLGFPIQTVEENDVVIAAVTPEQKAAEVQTFFNSQKPLDPKALKLPEEPPQQQASRGGPQLPLHPYKVGAVIHTHENVFGAPRRGGRTHPGIDLFRGEGKPIYAVKAGVVYQSYKETEVGCGHIIGIRHNDGSRSRYVHLGKRLVKKDQVVSRGQKIGDEGAPLKRNCGIGFHLHYEYYKPGLVNPFCVKHQPHFPSHTRSKVSLQRYRKCKK